jgi:hypothetical protein
MNNDHDPQSTAEVASKLLVAAGKKRVIYPHQPLNKSPTSDDGTGYDIPHHIYFRIVNDSKLGDQQPLRKLWKLAELEGVNITKLKLNEKSIASLLEKHKQHGNPERYARQILICLGRVLEAHPQLFAHAYEQVISTRIQAIPDAEIPDQFREDIETWIGMTPITLAGRPNPANALTLVTIESYICRLKTILAALQMAGVRLDHSVDVAFLMQRIAVAQWLPVLKKWSARGTIRGHLAAILRVGADLPGQSESDIEYLRARLAEVTDDLALDADRLATLASWTEPVKHACLLSAPDVLMKVAEDNTVPRPARLLAAAAGFAFQLMWEHPGLSEEAIAEFDLAAHISGSVGVRSVLRIQPASGIQPAVQVPEKMSLEAESLLDRLSAVRRSMSVPSTLLLPGADGRPREPRAAMEVMYNKIQAVLSERLTSSDLRDINAYIALDDKNSDLPEIAVGLGYVNQRSHDASACTPIVTMGGQTHEVY